MEHHQLPTCYFPTTVVFIDDNQNFLTTLCLKLDTQNIIPKLFLDPIDAIQYLQTEHHPNPFTNRCLHYPKDFTLAPIFSVQPIVDIDLKAISQEIYNPLRHSEISVIVVDYAMPSMNGIDFARKIKSKRHHFKILMLTGEANNRIAIEAFNEGLIDRFIPKSAENLYQLTNATIIELQHRYFVDLMHSLLKKTSIRTTLEDPDFITLFQKILVDNQITEFYLTDVNGGFLLLDFDGVASWLAIRDEQGMKDAYHIASTANIPISDVCLEGLENRSKMLCLFQDAIYEDCENSQNLIFPAEKLQGRKLYYYTLIKDLDKYPVYAEKIFSCRGFVDEAPV